MRSLRRRLGTVMAAGAVAVTLFATVAIGAGQWQRTAGDLIGAVELAAFQLSETTNPSAPAVSLPVGTDVFAVLLDNGADVISSSGSLSPDLLDSIIEDVWTETTEQDVAVTVGYDDDRTVASGVPCVDPSVCDTAVVGASEEPLGGYLAARALWLIGPSLIAGLIALFATWWLVGRSLRPVDEMREELEAITDRDLDRRVPTPHTGDELERLAAAMNDTIDRLAAAVAANERFVADAAHELRSPITGVRAALEVEAANSPGPMTDDSIRELDRAARIIDDLLLLARRQAEDAPVGDVDLDDVVIREATRARSRFPEVTFDVRAEPARISGDADALHRVVANLLENAAFYGNGRVDVAVEREGPRVVLSVDDNGPGIPQDRRSEVFERFARLDESRSRATGGSGLGLAIVRELVVAHGGTVTVGDAALGGASFNVVLPTL